MRTRGQSLVSPQTPPRAFVGDDASVHVVRNLEQNGFVAVHQTPLVPAKEWAYGRAEFNATGRRQRSMRLPDTTLRKLVAPHLGVIRLYLGAERLSVISAHGISSSGRLSGQAQALHRDCNAPREAVVLAVPHVDKEIDTLFKPCSNRDVNTFRASSSQQIMRATAKGDPASGVLYDAYTLHGGAPGCAPCRLFITVTAHDHIEELRILAKECAEYNTDHKKWSPVIV